MMQMEIIFYIVLFIFGTLFGSFASVMIARIHSQQGGIIQGRSECPNCHTTLGFLELIPLVSWIRQGGKCAHCSVSISPIYPILEITTGILFTCVGFFLIDPHMLGSGDLLEWGRMIYFLSLMLCTVIFVFYDILYLEIPEIIVLIANILTFFTLIVQGYGYTIFPYLPMGTIGVGDIILCGSIIIGLYVIMWCGLKDYIDVAIIGCLGGVCVFFLPSLDIALSTGVLAAFIIFLSFFIQVLISRGAWMGAGDLRIAILMGLIVGIEFAFPAWMLCYIAGSIVAIGVLLFLKQQGKNTRQYALPFGPFIAFGYLSVLFFYPYISQLLENSGFIG